MKGAVSRANDAPEYAAYRVTGIGGVFLRARNAPRLLRWYERHLGLRVEDFGGVTFFENPKASGRMAGSTTRAIFPRETTYFGRKRQAAMVDYRVKNLDALLRHFRRARIRDDPHQVTALNGRFAWAYDPEGNRFELWEPKEPDRARRKRPA
jgi:catechol 2,3-dioxygenase-like lactoylglutathione lyase family enzyme